MEIFIIDDDKSFGTSLKRLLTAKGYSPFYFQSGQSFLDAVPAGQRGIAIIDLHMPVLGGISLLSAMNTLRYTMPVIIITGQTDGDTRDTVLTSGSKGFLQKPFHEQSLIDQINLLEVEKQ